MVCCMCNNDSWLNLIDNSYFHDATIIEAFHYNMNTDITCLNDMIVLVRSYQEMIDSIKNVIQKRHNKCSNCALCGHVLSVDKSDHNDILESAVNYYTGIKVKQTNILCKLANCLDEMVAIDTMIGMENIKSEFIRLLKFIASIDPSELKKNPFLMHMVIMGPPGHGKTEIAKLLGRAFMKSGLLMSNKFEIATRADLIGSFCGHTAKATTAMFDKARGGVIFIDEVYSLGNPEKRDVFTGECINTINQLLSERSDTLCIIAGYEHEIDTCFFSYNSGLERRFPWRFSIKQYSSQDLVDIFNMKILNRGITLEEGALRASDIAENKGMFENAGGDILNLVTNCMLSYYDNKFLTNFSNTDITRNDVLTGLQRYLFNKKTKKDEVPPHGMYT